ncbi:MAG: hypothetical protein HQ515_25290, partial [Phycisphaeraceae bacterium]|nr:hypothetical protein [Phycisphaeraceae bacterium]
GLGIKTCVGTEAPLNVPDVVKERLQQAGKDPNDPKVVQTLYEGMFLRIKRTFPIDYYWVWGYEGQIKENAFRDDFLCAVKAAKQVDAPFGLGISGWGWIASNFPRLDEAFPRDVAFSCISGSVGRDFLSDNFKQLDNRQKWAIPWFEDDGGMISPQLHVGRMRRDAVDAEAYGCNGLMGLHWRTRILAPNISALAKAGWTHSGWDRPVEQADKKYEEKRPRSLPAGDFYRDWATAEFGKNVAGTTAEIFTRLDGKFPRASSWNRGPGAIVINNQPWSKVKPNYTFVTEMETLRGDVKGAGNLERFDYWLNTFRFARETARLACARGHMDRIMKQVNAEKDPAAAKTLAREQALPAKIDMIQAAGDMVRALLAAMNNSSEMGTLANIEQQSFLRCQYLNVYDKALAKILDRDLPTEALPPAVYAGEPRLIVPEKRTELALGEALTLKVIVLDNAKAKSGALYWREMGCGKYRQIDLKHKARAVYSVTIPSARADMEYYIKAETAGGKALVWPATAPRLNHTVIVN